MSESLPRVVLDTVVFVQALISGRGPASGIIERLRTGKFILLMSDSTFAELNDVPLRESLTKKYSQLTPDRVSAFVKEIGLFAVTIPKPPSVFQLPRDVKDEPFIDLAVAGAAEFIVTWNDRHLTYLMRQDTPEGRDFCARFPTIRILTPPEFLAAVDSIEP